MAGGNRRQPEGAGRLSAADPRQPRGDPAETRAGAACTTAARDGADPPAGAGIAGSGQRLKIKPEGSRGSLPAFIIG